MLNQKNLSGDYDNLSSNYDERFLGEEYDGIVSELQRFFDSEVTLEVACGTGHWLNLFPKTKIGLDYSSGMLSQAKEKNLHNLIQGNGIAIPLKSNSVNFAFMVNAIHFFEDRLKLFQEVFRVLKKKGKFLIIFADIYDSEYEWYLYDFFKEVKIFDEKRFVMSGTLENEIEKTGFGKLVVSKVEVIKKSYLGNEVWKDPFIKKYNSSQLSNLSEEDYRSGILAIKKKISDFQDYSFNSTIVFKGILGYK